MINKGGQPMKKRLQYLILPVITLILEILPYGAVCNFANPEGEAWRKTFSYFDLTPFGYANFAPFLTAIITCLIFAMLLAFVVKGNVRTANRATALLCVAVVVSLGPLVFGVAYFSLVAALITLSLIGEWILLQVTIKSDERLNEKKR